ncbi:MAG: DciA family protein [Coxiellaceae bacterium]|nr:DciA family protein [Coxiellaceae bacterium]
METLYREIPTAVDACIGTSLNKIIQKAHFLLALDHYTQTILPDTLKSYCHVMNVQNGVLILGISSASIAMRIKMMSSNIMRDVRKDRRFAAICDLKCTVCAKTVRY